MPFSYCTKHSDLYLFIKNSKLKSSAEIAQELGRLSLSGEGDIVRRLHLVTKYDLLHVQYPLDDFQYEIKNLSIDMRDGIRLTKLFELMSGKVGYSQQLRWPAIGTMQKCQNLSTAFNALENEGIDLRYDDTSITVQDIESGSREKTLFMLWKMISKWRLPHYLRAIDLRAEIRFLKTLLRCRNYNLFTVEVISITHRLTKVETLFDDSRLNDLLEWAALVSALCNKAIRNFASSFSNKEQFQCFLEFYFPRTAISLEDLLRGHFQSFLGTMQCWPVENL